MLSENPGLVLTRHGRGLFGRSSRCAKKKMKKGERGSVSSELSGGKDGRAVGELVLRVCYVPGRLAENSVADLDGGRARTHFRQAASRCAGQRRSEERRVGKECRCL